MTFKATLLYWGVRCQSCGGWVGLASVRHDPITDKVLLPPVLPNWFQADCPCYHIHETYALSDVRIFEGQLELHFRDSNDLVELAGEPA
jgi:hypothetical protein